MIYIYDELEKMKYENYLYIKAIIEKYNKNIIKEHIKYNDRLCNVLSLFLLLVYLYDNKIIEEIYTYNVDDNNKPKIKNIKFNISHCSKAVAVAIDKEENLGIDIEEKIINYKELREYVLSDKELKIKNMNEKKFRKLWTLKECFAKYDGSGLRINPKDIDFSEYLKKDIFEKNNLKFMCYEKKEYTLSVCCKKNIINKYVTNEEIEKYINILK